MTQRPTIEIRLIRVADVAEGDVIRCIVGVETPRERTELGWSYVYDTFTWNDVPEGPDAAVQSGIPEQELGILQSRLTAGASDEASLALEAGMDDLGARDTFLRVSDDKNRSQGADVYLDRVWRFPKRHDLVEIQVVVPS